jgi:hypothetical protein
MDSLPPPMTPITSKPEDLYLYVLMNVAYDSMGYGRCAAQSGHAANQFTDDYIITPLLEGRPPDAEVMAWRSQANGFGTQIVKAVPSLDELKMVLALASAIGAKTKLLIDPQYVLQDGTSIHIIQNVITGGYVFGDKTALNPLLWRFPLLLNDPVDRERQFRKE